MSNQRVPFRLFNMPCCRSLICWVNPRIPNYCPECGERVLVRLKQGDCTTIQCDGWLKLDEPESLKTLAAVEMLPVPLVPIPED